MQGTSSLFITDPLESLNPKKDTTILWMQEASNLGGQILQCETKDLIYEEQQTFTKFSEIKDPRKHPQVGKMVDEIRPLKDFDYIFTPIAVSQSPSRIFNTLLSAKAR